MTYTTNKSNSLIPPHGGYRKLLSFQMATIIYDLSVLFVPRYIPANSRTRDQVVQAARSGKQNIAEASQASGTSKKTELKLLNVARASLEELLQDYEDFLRQKDLPVWEPKSAKAQAVRALAYASNKSYSTYSSYLSSPKSAANCLICLIHQANYLLDRQLRSLETEFLQKGGFTERLYQKRKEILNGKKTY